MLLKVNPKQSLFLIIVPTNQAVRLHAAQLTFEARIRPLVTFGVPVK